MVTLKDVAKKAEVTLTTVSRMLNTPERVSAKTSAKIHQAMEELGYRPNEFARSLAKNKSHIIGMIVTTLSSPYIAECVKYTERYAARYGYKLLLCVSNEDAAIEKELFTMLMGNRVAGIVVGSHAKNLSQFTALDVPVVTIGRVISPRVPAAYADNYQGSRMAVEHLMERGATQILYIGGMSNVNMKANTRWQAVRDVCSERGAQAPIQLDTSLNEFLCADYSKSIAACLDKHHEINGVLASNDIIAAQVLQYCHQRGLDVPARMRIVAYDDTRLAALTTPSLTAVRQPVESICRHAVETIIRASNDEGFATQAIFPVRLVVRQST